jgi:hypothetical protein
MCSGMLKKRLPSATLGTTHNFNLFEKVPVFNENAALPLVAGRQSYRTGPSRDKMILTPSYAWGEGSQVVTQEHPKASWFRGRALEANRLALRATDPRIKRLHAAEAERWLRLAQLKLGTAAPDPGMIAAE